MDEVGCKAPPPIGRSSLGNGVGRLLHAAAAHCRGAPDAGMPSSGELLPARTACLSAKISPGPLLNGPFRLVDLETGPVSQQRHRRLECGGALESPVNPAKIHLATKTRGPSRKQDGLQKRKTSSRGIEEGVGRLAERVPDVQRASHTVSAGGKARAMPRLPR